MSAAQVTDFWTKPPASDLIFHHNFKAMGAVNVFSVALAPTTPILDVMNDLNEKTATTSMVTFNDDDRRFVVAVARRIVRTEEAADDVAQDAMLLAFRYRDTFRGDSKYRTWLYRIASSAALGYLRRQRRRREQLAAGTDRDVHDDAADPAGSPMDRMLEAERAKVAERLIDQLAPKYRDVLVLRTELTVAETAAQLGISPANVKVRTHRATQQLRVAAA